MNDSTNRALRVGIIGSGYVGLTSAACLSRLGHDVVALDIDADKIAGLRRGEIPIFEPGLDQLVHDGQASQSLRFTVDYHDLADREMILLCLPTPRGADGVPDMSAIAASAVELAKVLAPDTVVVTKSTVPVGSHQQIRTWLDRDDLVVASNPEFLREGSAIEDFMDPDRVVIGANSDRAVELISELYAPLGAQVQVTDIASAELIKYASNSFLATKLSFINEMARLCEATGADIDAVATGMGSDRRIGTDFMRPGPGWGGSCFPKDTRGLASLADQADLDLAVTNATIRSNQQQLDYTFERAIALLDRPVDEARIGAWGVTFKANTDDVRDSPAVSLVQQLVNAGASVATYDPAASAGSTPGVWVDDIASTAKGAHLLVVLTEWDEFGDVDFSELAELVDTPVIFDTREVIDHAAAVAAGFTVHRIGRPTLHP